MKPNHPDATSITRNTYISDLHNPYKILFYESRDALVITTRKGTLIEFNPAAVDLFKISDAEMEKTNFRQFYINDEDRIKFIRNADKSGTLHDYEIQLKDSNGKIMDCVITVMSILSKKGSVDAYLGIIRDITEKKKKEKELEFVAYHDLLTNLPNRKSFYQKIEKMLAYSRRRKSDDRWALLFLDLDKFKEVNDTLGHDIGDLLLKSVAKRLKFCLRESDFLFRLGGDEFTILLANIVHDTDAARVAKKILKHISRPYFIHGNEIFTSTSIGISVFPNDGWDVEALVKNADMAMYSAKKEGCGYRFFIKEMNQKVVERMQLENNMREALERDEFIIYYQALVNDKKQIMGMEALLRWHHPEYGLMRPSTFIHVAEETGKIVSIGKWVLETACMQTKRWHDLGFDHLFLAVNLSTRQLKEESFVQIVMDTIKRTGLPASSLKLEITESSVMENPEDCLSKMENLKKIGIRFFIDDFGTGYSSLGYLKRFPIDTLKIDRSFISEALKSKENLEIIKTIISMAKSLNISTIAEGVETMDQLDFLTEQGCGTMQGYYFAKPLTGDQFKKLLDKQKDNVKN